MCKLVNEHAECLREQADEIESLDTVEMAIVGATMRNAANEIDRQAAELSKLRALLNDVYDDLLLRASIGGQGEKVVSIGATIWNRICALRGEQS